MWRSDDAKVLARVGLGLASFGLAVSGVVVATGGTSFLGGGVAPTAALMPAAAVSCLAAGPYRAPEWGSVGVPAGLTLCPSGPLVVTTPGTVLDGLDVRGGIVVDAADVVVRRSRVTGDGRTPYGVHTTSAGSVRIEDTTLTGDFPEAAVGDERWTGERIEIMRVTRGGARLGDGARLRNSWLHDFAPASGSAPDALVLSGSGADVLVEDNRIEIVPGVGSAVRLVPAGPGGRDAEGRGAGGRGDSTVVIRGNVLGGGRYTVHEEAVSGGQAEVWITGNRFHRDAAQGPLRVSPRAVLIDNTFLDGGLLPSR